MAARSRWVTGNIPYRNRTLRILVSPSPVTFAERRSILQVLEKQGPIEVFKRTPDYPSNFISIAKTPETADQLVASSPLTYTLEKGESPDLSFSDLARPRRLDGTKPAINAITVRDSSDASQTATNQERRTFTLEIYAEDSFNHAGTFSSRQLHSSWPKAVASGETFMSRTLTQSLPNNVATPGLSRWEADADTRTVLAKKTARWETLHWVPSRIQRGEGKADS